MFLGISKIRHLFLTPLAFKEGEMAKQIAPFPLEGSATTKSVSKGSSPLATHSTDAKKHFKSIHKYTYSICNTPY